MSFSVGLLYSTQDFLNLLSVSPLKASEFPKVFNIYGVASSKLILQTSIQTQWVTLDLNDRLLLTSKGKEILQAKNYDERLRIQILHLIMIEKPTWASVIHYGRSEAVKYFKPDVYQCFEEAGLLKGMTEDIVSWWDKLGSYARAHGNETLLLFGRKGERLSMEYEGQRVGVQPTWQSLESNFSGYDILSQKGKDDNTPLMIEVKATSGLNEKISIHVSKNEWEVASQSSQRYIFHVWEVATNMPYKLYLLDADSISQHIPQNRGTGEWESTLINLDRKCLIPDYIVDAEMQPN